MTNVRILTFAFIVAATMVATATAGVKPGHQAPAFALKDVNGKEHKLSDFKGKYVVLEWVNYNCPFVKKHYSGGDMQALQKKYTGAEVVWLSIASTNPKHRDYKAPAVLAKEAKQKGAAATAILMDADGKVGKAYGAKTTPHMYVVGPGGKLVYQGAIDSIKSANKADVAKAQNYVTGFLDAVLKGKPAPYETTAPYGCGVKYAK